MDSSCKYPVSPIDAVSVSMIKLSLLKVPSDESICPQRNCIARTVQHLYQPESADDKTSDCVSSSTDNSDGKSTSSETIGECVEVLSECSRVSNSSFHQMTLRPKLVSPRHCIITICDDSENEESSDSDYTVDLDQCYSTSSDEETDSCFEGLNSSDEASSDSDMTPARVNELVISIGESSDTDEDTTESSSSDEEIALPAKHSTYSDENSTESSRPDEYKPVLRIQKPSDSAKETSLLTVDSEEEWEAFVCKLENYNKDKAPSEVDASELSRVEQPNHSNSDVVSKFNQLELNVDK